MADSLQTAGTLDFWIYGLLLALNMFLQVYAETDISAKRSLTTLNTEKKSDKYFMNTYGRYPLVLESGKGGRCTGEDGREYIDFGSGIGVNSLGFCDEDWVDAVCKQVKTVQHTSNYYYNGVQADFAEKLCELTGYDKVFLGNSGAEANECAIKLARKYSFDKYGPGRHNIITLDGSFHGRTVTTLSATGQDNFHNYYFPFTEGFVYAKADDPEDLRSKADETVCAVMIEYIQGEGGVNDLSREFVDLIFEICSAKDILVIADEVQTGVGRTGKFFAGDWYGKKADIVTLAKGLAGGLPIGCCLASEKCADVMTPGTHGSTFGGNPVSCAGGLVVLGKLESSGFLDEVNRKAGFLRSELAKIPEVEELTGKGLMVGIKLKNKKAADVARKAFERGLLVLTAKEKVRLLPPLTIETENLTDGLDILRSILEE